MTCPFLMLWTAFDNPDLIVACVIGDGEAETGALATSWHSNKFLNPARDGAVLPILHLNGFKIANPTVLARISRQELTELLRGYGYDPHFVEGDDPELVHQTLAGTLDKILVQIRQIQSCARSGGEGQKPERPRWPMIVLRTPKGWTGPKVVDGLPVEGVLDEHYDEHDLLIDATLMLRPYATLRRAIAEMARALHATPLPSGR